MAIRMKMGTTPHQAYEKMQVEKVGYLEKVMDRKYRGIKEDLIKIGDQSYPNEVYDLNNIVVMDERLKKTTGDLLKSRGIEEKYFENLDYKEKVQESDGGRLGYNEMMGEVVDEVKSNEYLDEVRSRVYDELKEAGFVTDANESIVKSKLEGIDIELLKKYKNKAVKDLSNVVLKEFDLEKVENLDFSDVAEKRKEAGDIFRESDSEIGRNVKETQRIYDGFSKGRFTIKSVVNGLRALKSALMGEKNTSSVESVGKKENKVEVNIYNEKIEKAMDLMAENKMDYEDYELYKDAIFRLRDGKELTNEEEKKVFEIEDNYF